MATQAGQGLAWQGMAGRRRRGVVRPGEAGPGVGGMAWQGIAGGARFGLARHGNAGVAGQG
jgi:hypothetical protein